ncbi:sphingomyelin phosphodiesterase-like isoform X1 [Hetaerina americana]|uniref:sphingomyelin phosphodiesterase-like isoform X1 n=1 Tax=Hetaerina americana TaxID=62018 RepID=UPI003A7F53B7
MEHQPSVLSMLRWNCFSKWPKRNSLSSRLPLLVIMAVLGLLSCTSTVQGGPIPSLELFMQMRENKSSGNANNSETVDNGYSWLRQWHLQKMNQSGYLAGMNRTGLLMEEVVLMPVEKRMHVIPGPSPRNASEKNNVSYDSEEQTIQHFNALRLNYSALIKEIDQEINEMITKRRNGSRSLEFSWNAFEGHQKGHLPRIVDKALRLLNLKQVVTEVETSVMSKVSCTACKAGVGLLQHYIKTGRTASDIIRITKHFCVNLKIQTPRVCDGITELFGGEVTYVLKRVDIGPDEVCSFVIGDACGEVDNPSHEWKVQFPPVPKPAIVNNPPPKPGTTPTFKVLHLSDTHFDPYYEEGTNAECNEPLCCRLTNGRPLHPSAAAGRWGDYRKCDTPKRTVDSMLEHISNTHPDIDYILWTGDLPPHDVWNQTREENLMVLRQTIDQLSEIFPNIPIFPALGNHESAPVNSFPPPFIQRGDFSMEWLYNAIDEQWRRWLPSSVSGTIRRGAFYSVLVRPGFRIISLNMNYCNNKNWWLLLNSTDPATELQWMIYELQAAEFNREKVHIIGHIPPGHPDCLRVWSRNYYYIINRYESTIAAQFFGHTHFDEFEIFYDEAGTDPTRPTSIAYVGPSVTPYFDLNPGYRIYYVDGDHKQTTRSVLDHETWVMNLKEANLYNYPIWYKLYSTRAAYGLPSLSPTDWDAMLQKLTEDSDLFDLYYKHYWKNSPVRPICDANCRKRMLCDLRSGRSHDRRLLCQEIESRVDAATKTGWRSWILNGLALSYVANAFSAFSWVQDTMGFQFMNPFSSG